MCLNVHAFIVHHNVTDSHSFGASKIDKREIPEVGTQFGEPVVQGSIRGQVLSCPTEDVLENSFA